MERHVGDIGNIISEDLKGKMVANIDVTDTVINLKEGDTNNILGRTVVIHQFEDFYNSSIIGPRISCGIINKGN